MSVPVTNRQTIAGKFAMAMKSPAAKPEQNPRLIAEAV
jgi:hypothetical protein